MVSVLVSRLAQCTRAAGNRPSSIREASGGSGVRGGAVYSSWGDRGEESTGPSQDITAEILVSGQKMPENTMLSVITVMARTHTLDNMTGGKLYSKDTGLVFAQQCELIRLLLSFLHLLSHHHVAFRELLDLLPQVLVHCLHLVKTQVEEVIINVLIG